MPFGKECVLEKEVCRYCTFREKHISGKWALLQAIPAKGTLILTVINKYIWSIAGSIIYAHMKPGRYKQRRQYLHLDWIPNHGFHRNITSDNASSWCVSITMPTRDVVSGPRAERALARLSHFTCGRRMPFRLPRRPRRTRYRCFVLC